MANNENNWNSKRNVSDRNDDNDRDYNDRSSNERWNEPGKWSNERQGSFRSSGNEYTRGSDKQDFGSGYSDNNFQNERWQGDNDSSNNRGRYGNSTGVNRGSGNYQDNSWNSNSRERGGYAGQDYGYDRDRHSNDRSGSNDRNWFDKTADEVSAWFGDDEAARRRKMDEVGGQHKGKGPKSYTRSDERIQDDVNDRLSDDDNVDASDIEVSVSKGEVTLSGTVASRWEKRRAEDVAESVSGVKDVENRIKVKTNQGTSNTENSGSDTGSYGVPYGSSGAAPVGAFDIGKQ